jgi:hypothetical protein
MNDPSRKKITIWEGIIEYDEPAVGPVAAAIDASLAEFEQQHKTALLGHLQKAYERGPKSNPFDAEKSWERFARLAWMYFWRARVNQTIVPTGERRTRLRALATALGRPRRMAARAVKDSVGDDLFSAWWELQVHLDPTELLTLSRARHEFNMVVQSLVALEKAALQAVDEVPKRRGRTAFLSWDFIGLLAEEYQNNTGSKPGAGDGPFAEFVHAFATALGCSKVEYDSVVDAIKDALARARMSAAPTQRE